MSEPCDGSLVIHDDTERGQIVYLRVDANGCATGFNGHVDLGTGLETALAQIVAEELELPLDTVRMVLGDTDQTPDQGPTIASESIQVAAVPLRQAAAQARQWLVSNGARRLNAPEEEVTAKGGRVHWQENSCGYGELIAGQEISLQLDSAVRPKDPREYRIVGQKTGRRDLPAKLKGEYSYIHDVRVEGMLHGHVVRPPYAGRDSGDFVGASLIGYDEAAIADRDGFVAVVREGDFLGVIARRPDQARELAEALPAHWRIPPSLPDMTTLAQTIREQPATPRVLDTTGDFERGMAEASITRKRSYVWPYHEHGSIGPSCAVADWNDGEPVVWSGSQNPHMLREDLAVLTGLSADSIHVRRYQAAGCYGRNCADDVCGDALLMSRAVGRPVRVQLTRAQEHLWEPKGAAQIMDVAGGLRDGVMHAYSLDTWYPSNRGPNLALLLTGRISPEPRPSDMGDRTIVPPYSIPNKRITVHDMAPVVRAAWMRGVSALPNTFAHESFIDEMAAEAGEDPVAFRLKHVEDRRTADLIERTAEAAGWEPRRAPRRRREGRMAYGQGFAFATYVHGSFPGTAAAAAAWICDVAVDTETGEVTLSRVFVGQDQGLVINPDGVRQQIHGNVIQTASRSLIEEVTFDAISPTPASWAAYPIQTFPVVPDIETMLIERPGDPPLGVGESAAVPSAAAIANAIFDATGVRLREVPFTPERVREAMGVTVSSPKLPSIEKPRRSLARRAALWGGAIAGMLTMGAVALPLSRAIPPGSAPPPGLFSQETLARGAEVFATGNCATCHTDDNGPANAGGRAFDTPFGTVWSTNITSDPDTGLGRWSYDAFERAMRHGISRDGSNLYPAFPYTSFARMDDGDMYALYAYMQTLEPVRQDVPTAQMIFPANIRSGMAVWNRLFHDATAFNPDTTRSAEWNRGKYLVEATGHCSACHAPRNLAGAEKPNMSGAMIKGWFAPALEGKEAGARGWTADGLFDYLRDGHAEPATAAGPMAEVVASLKSAPDSDIRAISVYLASQMDQPDRLTSVTEAELPPSRASRLYESACAACHDPAISDSFTAAKSPLTQSAALRAPTPEALFTILDQGIKAPDALDLGDMPSFAGEFSVHDRNRLAAYLRARFAPDLPEWR